MLDVLPQLVGNRGVAGLKLAIAEPDRYVIEPKVDGVRGLVAFLPDRTVETRNRRGVVEIGSAVTTSNAASGASRSDYRSCGTAPSSMASSSPAGSRGRWPRSTARDELRFVVFDVPFLAGADLRRLPWEERRERLELLAQAFDVPFELSPVVTPDPSLVEAMIDGRLEGLS